MFSNIFKLSCIQLKPLLHFYSAVVWYFSEVNLVIDLKIIISFIWTGDNYVLNFEISAISQKLHFVLGDKIHTVYDAAISKFPMVTQQEIKKMQVLFQLCEFIGYCQCINSKKGNHINSFNDELYPSYVLSFRNEIIHANNTKVIQTLQHFHW